jgi:hypothetical protein
MAATTAVAGMVSSQAINISVMTPHRTCDLLCAAPTPIIDELTT